jgi:hypothetical protein
MAWVTAVDTLWRGLRRPWLLIAGGAAVLLLLLSALLLPQLPGQLSRDPTATARWLVGVSAEYGPLGGILRGLSLFNVLHGFLIQLVLALLTLILLIYLADLVRSLWWWRRLPGLLAQPPVEPGTPLPLPQVQKLYRRRSAAQQLPGETERSLQNHLAQRFDQIQRVELPLPPVEQSTEAEAPGVEIRLLALRPWRWAYLRLAFVAGLLLAITVVWWIVLAGWEVAAPVLAPGAEYRAAAQQLLVQYHVVTGEGDLQPQVRVGVNEAQVTIPVTTSASVKVAGVDVETAPAAPGLYIATVDGAPALARAGQAETEAGLGLTFPSAGSEESVILPAQAVGLRIVRLVDGSGGQANYMLEIYQGDSAQPTERVELGRQAVERVTVSPANPNGDETILQFVRLPGVAVVARYLPGLQLLWVALLLFLLGTVGFWQQPAFVLAQIGPWPVERSVVVLQSDQAAAIDWQPLEEQLQPAQEAT